MTGYPLRTARLELRLMRPRDAEAHVAYHSDPEVAAHQLRDLPYPVEPAVESLTGQDGRDDVALGEWTALAVTLDGTLIGDLVTHVDPTGGVAEIGFTLARRYQGHGYATEAATAVVHDLVDRIGVGRVAGELDPADVGSQRVLEQAGLVFEAVTKRSFLRRGEWTDTMHYATTSEKYRAWRDRSTGRPEEVRLVPLTPDNQRAYAGLATHHSQERFVATMHQSYADALFPEVVDAAPVVPRLRGVEADGRPAGFLMIAEVTAAHPEPFLWRLLVDRMQQGRGIGRLALDLLVAELRDEGNGALLTSWVEGPGGPAPFYLRYGFTTTGGDLDGEVVARLDLRQRLSQ